MKTKKFIFIIVCSWASLFCQAQITNNTVWTEYNINIQSNYIVYKYQYWTANDTIINGQTYTKIEDKDRYLGAIREENGKIYAHLNYGSYMNMENEFLLYDFTVQEGDTIKSTAIDGALSHPDGITVRQIDEITLENGEKRKKIYFNETEPWIEGIGSTFGLFHDAMSHFANYSVSYLVCFKQNEIPLYVNTEKCLDGRCCELLNDTGINSLYPADKMVVLPNPTPGRATILLPENNRLENKIKIIDNTGQIIQTYLVRGNELKIDLSSYPAGMYYAIIDWDNPIQSYKIIKQ